MKLLSMKLTNFKGLQSLMLDFPDGGNYSIYGTNGAGKTTIVDALTWLLFDKDNSDTKDFGIKTIVDGEPLHHAEHSVECAFLMGNGLRVTLKKVFKEKWTRPRNKTQDVFVGHTTECYVDGVPRSVTEYKRYISGIIDEKTFKVLTNPLYFNENLKDAERRSILMDIIGGVDQDVIIAENLAELKELQPLLQGRKVEDYRLIVKQSLAKTKRDIEAIEPAIKEHQAMMISGADAVNKGMYEEARKKANDKIVQIMKDIAAAQVGATSIELETEIASTQSRIKELQLDDTQKNREAEARMNDVYRKSLQAFDESKKDLKLSELEQADLQEKINSCIGIRKQLLQEFANAKSTAFTESEIVTHCPTCGQELPEERIELAKAKQEDQRKHFMQNRAEKLKSINERGRLNNEAKEALEKKLEEVNAAIEAKTAAHKKAQEKVNVALYVQQHYQAVVNPDITTLEAKLSTLLQKRDTPDTVVCERIAELEAKQKEAEKSMAEAQAKLNDIEQNRKHQARIRELQEKEKELSAMFAELTKQQYLCDQYSRCLTDYIDRRVADKFKLARFVMYENNISNDGAKECCKVVINGTPYHDLCQTEQMHVGLDIIQTLGKYYNVTMPVLIDRSESFVSLPKTDMQIIRLVVSADDKTLRVEKN